MNDLKIALLTGAVFALSGCTNAQESVAQAADQAHKMSPPSVQAAHSDVTHASEKAAGHKNHGYKKLSAAIDFRTDFSGKGNLGVVETVNISVLNRTGGKVSYEVLDSPGLKVFKNSGLQETVATIGESGEALSLQFQPLSEGVHNLIVLAKIQLPDGQFMSKTHSIPVYVGQKFQPPKNKPDSLAPKVVTGDQEVIGIIEMKAEETIKD